MISYLKQACIALLVMSCNQALAIVKLPAIFGDNMILQRDMKVPVWGWADAGEKVEIQFMGKTYTTRGNHAGKFELKLGSYKAGGPCRMVITGRSNTLTYNNIWIGDVWGVSGQSNMELGIQQTDNAAASIAGATDSLIHFFYRADGSVAAASI
ncbi:hypothetical protein ACQ86N_15365 [Puia sp. P3]|uniref:hypothetical protein n=1 Tax=Puia sp. P3 TaxID=3423952 RepID=UPI003D66FD2C